MNQPSHQANPQRKMGFPQVLRQSVSAPEDDRKRSPAGRVRHEPGGRAVWEWAVDSGRTALDSTSRLLKKLDLSGLTLVGDDQKSWEKDQSRTSGQPGPTPPAAPDPDLFGGAPELDPMAQRPQSFDPYDNRASRARGVTPPSRTTPASKVGPAPKVAPASKAVPKPAGGSRTPTAAAAEQPKRGLLSRLFNRDT